MYCTVLPSLLLWIVVYSVTRLADTFALTVYRRQWFQKDVMLVTYISANKGAVIKL